MEKRKISYFIVFMNICMSKSSLSWRNSIDSFARRTHILSHNWTNFTLNCLNYSPLLISLYFCVLPAICVRGGGGIINTRDTASRSLYSRAYTRVWKHEAVDWNYLVVIYSTRGPLTTTVASMPFFFLQTLCY